MNKLQDWKTNLTRKQRVILLIVVAVVVLALLTAPVFRDNVVSFFRWATYSQQNDSPRSNWSPPQEPLVCRSRWR